MKNVIGSLIILFLASMAHAQTTPVVDARQQNQRGRIKAGVVSGEVSRAEAARLRSEQRSIKRAERRAKADGKVTKNERGHLNRKQNRASRKIRRQKHDY
jgi:hypothetical protein